MDKVLVILPAYNEEKSIGGVIDEIRSLEKGYEILVVDNNSTDKTAEIAQAKGTGYLFVKEQGKGCAVREALYYPGFVDALVMVDSDGTYPAIYIDDLLSKLEKYDVVLGRRWRKDRGAMSLTNRFGNRVLSWVASILYHKRVHDLCTGMWALNPLAIRVLKDSGIKSRGFTLEAEMFSVLSKAGLSIGEVPIVYKNRVGEAKLRILDGLRIGWCLIKERVR